MNSMNYQILTGFTRINQVDSFIKDVGVFAEKHHLMIQMLDAQMICGLIHVESAVRHALRAMDENRMSTQKIEMEILLYTSGERQLIHAIPKMGIKTGNFSIIVIFLSEKMNKNELIRIISLFEKQFRIIRDDAIIKPSLDKLKKWGITEKELVTIPEKSYEDLILEKIALVDIIK